MEAYTTSRECPSATIPRGSGATDGAQVVEEGLNRDNVLLMSRTKTTSSCGLERERECLSESLSSWDGGGSVVGKAGCCLEDEDESEVYRIRGIQRFPQQSWEEKTAAAKRTGRRSALGGQENGQEIRMIHRGDEE